MTLRLLLIAGAVGVLLAAAVMLIGCAPMRPTTVIVNCPQPTTEALAPPEPRLLVPALSANAGEAIGQLAIVIAQDDAWADNETARRETLIKHGVERCGWTR